MSARARSTLIAFPLERARPPGPRAADAPSAKVVIFSGVRIERLADEVVPLQQARGDCC